MYCNTNRHATAHNKSAVKPYSIPTTTIVSRHSPIHTHSLTLTSALSWAETVGSAISWAITGLRATSSSGCPAPSCTVRSIASCRRLHRSPPRTGREGGRGRESRVGGNISQSLHCCAYSCMHPSLKYAVETKNKLWNGDWEPRYGTETGNKLWNRD